MIGLAAPALLIVVAVIVQIALPGRAVYHTGWYNVGLAALVIYALFVSRARFRAARTTRARLAIVAIVVGAASAGVAGVTSGLLGPDNETIVGAPGQRARVEGLGALAFPLVSVESAGDAAVTLERALRAPTAIGPHPHDAGNFILRALPRDVAYVEAWDSRGNHLTVTQPTGATFLSPVLLMEHRQTIAGLNLPFDSFNLPAARRVVKAVLFTPAQAAMFSHGLAQPGEAAVLFAVDDENDRLLPHGIALSAGGRTVEVGGLHLRAMVTRYPAIEVASAPNLVVTAIGAMLVLGGIASFIAPRR